MMRSCGILLYRRTGAGAELWLGHMGGPFWAKQDAAAWSIPKGEPLGAETALAAALREFEEETGTPPPPEDYELLGEFRQPSGKIVTVFTAETDAAVPFVSSNTFELEWPPHSGRIGRFPEIDAGGWVPLNDARGRLVRSQLPMLEALERRLG